MKKKFIINTFFIFSIVTLLISLILLTSVFLWENRSTIAKNFGINLKDNCKISDLQLQCGYIEVSAKNVSLKLKDTKAKLDIVRFFKKSEPFIFVKVKEGKIYLKLKEKRKKTTNSPVNYAFFLIYFVKSEIDRLDIHIDTVKGKFLLKDFSFFNSYDRFYIKKPFHFMLRDISGIVTDLYGNIEVNNIKIKNLKAIINGNSLSVSGNFDYEGNFTFKGNFKGKDFKLRNTALNNFHLSFRVNRQNNFLNGNLQFLSQSLKVGNFYAENSEGYAKFSGKRTLNGRLKVKIDSIKLKKLKGNNAYYDGKLLFIIGENGFKTKGNLSISSVKYDKLSPVPLNSDINISYKKKKLSVSGKVYIKEIPIQFNYENKILQLTGEKLSLRNIFSLYKPLDVNGEVWGKITVNFNDKTLTADIDGKNINAYGVSFARGKFLSQFSLYDKSGRFSLNLTDNSSYCFINGELINDKIDANITFDNLNTEEFVYGKKYHFWGKLTGTGRLNGYLPDFYINLAGTANSFYYDGINLNDVSFNFLFENSSKNMRLSFKTGNTNGLLAINLKPFSLHLNLSLKNSNLLTTKDFLKKKMPLLFSQITPQTATGTINVSVKNKRWKIKTEIKEGKVLLNKLKEEIFVSMKGEFSNTDRFMKVSFFKENFYLYKYRLKKISGNISLSKNKLITDIIGKGLENFDQMQLKIHSVFNIDSRYMDGNVSFFLKKEDFSNQIDSTFRGNLKNIKGFLKERGYIRKEPFIKTDLIYRVSFINGKVKTDVKTDILSITLPEKIGINFYSISGSIDIPVKDIKNSTGNILISSFTVSKNYIYFFESSQLKLSLNNKKITSEPVIFSGIIKGKIKKLVYNITDNTISMQSEGSLDKNLLPIIIRYVNTSGELRYILSFNGNVKEWKKNLYLSIFSDNLNIRTPYTIGIIKLYSTLLELEKGILKIKMQGKTTDSVLGESIVKLTGRGNIRKLNGDLNSYTQFFPVKFKNLFQGNINSEIKLKVNQKNNTVRGNLTGKILVSGKLKLEKNLENITKEKGKTVPSKGLESFEFLSLDLSLESYIPLYLYGKWGKAYAEFDLKVEGTGKNPLINGNINIIYGEIYFLKNRYSIDFANIKIINNEPYISARVSTSVADTFIFIDISGSAYDPKINFFSNPPKPKNEILSILLLKDTPSALENMPVFKTVGKLLYAILPFKPTEETGLFNTGFEVNILPQYSPSTGISASIYGKRNLTRRIFIALSKPLGQVEEEKIGGWYGIGIRLKERTSFQYKFFETGNQEFGIVFNLPFDF